MLKLLAALSKTAGAPQAAAPESATNRAHPSTPSTGGIQRRAVAEPRDGPADSQAACSTGPMHDRPLREMPQSRRYEWQ